MKRNPSIGELRRWWVSLGRTNRSFKRTRLGAIRAEWRTAQRSRCYTLRQLFRGGLVDVRSPAEEYAKAFAAFGDAARGFAMALNDTVDSLRYAVELIRDGYDSGE
jgi:hypothetical protein